MTAKHPAAARAAITAGDRVHVPSNATTAAGINHPYRGKTGTAIERYDSSGRWRVHFDDGTRASVIRRVLELARAAAPGEKSSRGAAVDPVTPAMRKGALSAPVNKRAHAYSKARVARTVAAIAYQRCTGGYESAAPARHGAQDYRKWPSRIGDALVYLDGGEKA